MCLSGPSADANDFQCNRPVETFLAGTINYPLTAPADFLQQLVILEVHFCWEIRFRTLILFIQERSEASLEEAEAAKSLRRVREDLAATFTADAVRTCRSTFRVITHLHSTVPNLVRSYVCS